MKARLTPKTTYTLDVGGQVIAGLERVDRWEGFAKLVTADGQTIIVDGMGAETRVVKASPDLVAKLGSVVQGPAMSGQEPSEQIMRESYGGTE